jgi:hypothetical protein
MTRDEIEAMALSFQAAILRAQQAEAEAKAERAKSEARAAHYAAETARLTLEWSRVYVGEYMAKKDVQ